MTSSTDQAIRPATEADIDELVVLQLHLFEQDAGVYERFADLTWPTREGHADFENLISSDDGLVLVAEIDDPGNGTTATGFLVGYLTPSSPTRQSVLYAVLRSLFVEAAHRGSGAGSAMTKEFIIWAQASGASEALVNAYAGNIGAQRFYDRHGFEAQSIQRTLPLTKGP